MEKEIWKDIPEYEGKYKVSNLGRVKRLSNERKTPTGGIWIKKETILQGSTIDKNNRYKTINFSNTSKGMYKTIHSIVWLAFRGEYDVKKYEIDHISEDRNDNRLCNLQLLTHRENVERSVNLNNKSSKYLGVSWDKLTQRWCCRIDNYDKVYWLGRWNDEKEASNIRERFREMIVNNYSHEYIEKERLKLLKSLKKGILKQ
jgi:hypothetical protein